jgi:hypothetical protein
MILNRKEQFVRNFHRELNARQIKYRKETYIEEVANDEKKFAILSDKQRKEENRNVILEVKRKRAIEKQEKLNAKQQKVNAIFEKEKKNLKAKILKYLKNDNIQISISYNEYWDWGKCKCKLLEDYTYIRDIHLIRQDLIIPIFKLLCESDEEECDTIIFSLHNSNLRALKYDDYKFVSEIYPQLLFSN